MKTKRIRTILPVIAMVLVLTVTAGTALAYFSDYEEAIGGATLKLKTETELEEGNDNKDKHIRITNTGETDMIVRVKVFGTELAGNTVMEVSDNSEDNSWVKNDDGFWYYQKILEPGQKTPELYGQLTASGTTLPENFDITVVHESTPAVFNNKNELKLPEGWNGPEGISVPTIPAQ